MLLLLAILIVPSRGRSNAGARSASLFAQSASQALNRDFPDKNVSFLVIDAHTGDILASRWDQPETPIPLGSLLKPFAALAYGQHHNFHYPTHICRGIDSGCWRPAGHGEVELSSAIAYSCNSYFRMLTVDMNSADMRQVSSHFDLELPDRETAGASLAGLGPEWRISPLRMARAYIELVHQGSRPGVAQILSGMRDSGLHGTGAAVDRSLRGLALVKTGTAICTHARHAPGDGFTVALIPADDPKILLLVRVHGVPGAVAAKNAGQMLRKIGE
jgi:cell division protein FtsI/penicillin-binding protein 2